MSAKGGGGRIIDEVVRGHELSSPEHERDMALLQSSFAKLTGLGQAKAVEWGAGSARINFRVRRIVSDLLRGLAHNHGSVLTSNQRNMCVKILGLAELPPVRVDPTPVQRLPLKPPRRITKEEDDT